MGINNFGGIIGPNVGAWLTTEFGWRSIFWFNVPVGIVTCIPIIFLLKTDKGEKNLSTLQELVIWSAQFLLL